MELLSSKIIKDKILIDYIDYQYLFVEHQSKFLSDLFSRYQNLENANLVLYFARQTHQDILRKKDYDLNFNTSYDRFWTNHSEIQPKRRSLIRIAEDTLLPKETVRRKILQLIKQKVLNKKKKTVGWLPTEEYKQSYNLFISKEIDGVSKLISFISKQINFPISREEIVKEIKEKFSFYWFHYLEVQLEYLKLWNKQFNDHELILIFLQVAHLFTSKAKGKNLSLKDLYSDPNILKEFVSVSISATSISEITKIPRPTCVRKLELLTKLKVISKNKTSKRYHINSNAISDNLISRKITENVVKIFSEFYFICIRAISSKK